MSKTELTQEQRAVVEHHGGALLVSAAAGSGKTKVLVDRLLRQICDVSNPCNIDDFLMITYTKAAAAELRVKIAGEIRKRLAEDPRNRHLRRQLTRIYQAEITTVHAFCARLLRTYAHQLNIPADFRVAEESECLSLKEKAMDDLMRSVYEEIDHNRNLQELFEALGSGRNDRKLRELVLALYQCVQCHAWPERWSQTCRDALREGECQDIGETVWGRYLLREMRSFLEEQISRMRYAVEQILLTPDLSPYLSVFQENTAMLEGLLAGGTWDTYAKAEVSFGTLKAVKNCMATEIQSEVKDIRESCKKQLEKYLRYFAMDSNLALRALEGTYPALRELLHLADVFSVYFRAHKENKRILDFSDLEHEAIRLLVDPYTGGPTGVAREVAANFREIMVDEYQDSNEVQDTIFRAVSRGEKNLFMVGDVKQSIYRFRLAEPEIFLKKYRSYTQQEDGESDSPRKILLSANFRSRPEILDAVNHVFQTVMSEEVGDIHYGEAERLCTIRTFEKNVEPCVSLHIISTETEDDEASLRKEEAEAHFVAEKISELIHGEHYVQEGEEKRRIRAEDIAVLMRSVSSTASVYTRALAERGIAASADKGDNIFETTEVCTLLAYLRIMDNPHQDIPLITALSSPVGGFTAEDLARIRCSGRKMDFYDALVENAKAEKKSKAFVDLLSDLRKKRRWMDLMELVNHVIERTDICNIVSVMPSGQQRVKHLQAFWEICSKAASQDITSLGALLRYIDGMREQNVSVSVEEETKSGVTIMSVHKSKGLEFPVVFLCDLSRKFNMDSLYASVMTDQELMIGCNVVDRVNKVQYPSAAKHALTVKKRKEMISEELRVLYVAMTRARERLYMTYCGDHMNSQIQKIAMQASYPAQRCVAANVANPGQWILLSAAVRPEAQFLFRGAKEAENICGQPWQIEYHAAEEFMFSSKGCVAAKTELKKIQIPTYLRQKVNWQCGSSIPAKMTATQLKGRMLDTESAESAAASVNSHRVSIRPRRFSASPVELTPTQKGTATHLFMQYCCFAPACDAQWLEAEKARMLRDRFLTQEQISALQDERILSFFQSDIGKFVLQAKDIRREFKFTVLMETDRYYAETCDEKMMLQGVVDCIVFTDDGLWVLDYKTDAVSAGKEEERAKEYLPQLTAYSEALSKIYNKPVVKKVLYFFATDTAIELS